MIFLKITICNLEDPRWFAGFSDPNSFSGERIQPAVDSLLNCRHTKFPTNREDGISPTLIGKCENIQISICESLGGEQDLCLSLRTASSPGRSRIINFVHSHCLAGHQLGFYILLQKISFERKAILSISLASIFSLNSV